MKKKNIGSLIFNAVVLIVCISLVIYFIFSRDGLKDLLSSSQGINLFWLFLAAVCHMCNSLTDSLLTWQFIRYKYKNVRFFDAMKVAMVGHFFSAVTPGASGGQPMQVYSMAKMNIDVGYGTAIMFQKFLVYQVTATLYSLVAFLMNMDFIFKAINAGAVWIFVILGLLSQLVVMALLVIVCYCPKPTEKLIVLAEKLMRKLKFKNVDQKIKSARGQVRLFHKYNKNLNKDVKLMVKAFIEQFILISFGFAVPYCIYRSLNLEGATLLQMISSQSFVTMISSMIPLPGASGAAEYSFSLFFGCFFTGATMKSAILLWRCVTYYGTIFVCAPFALITKGHGKSIAKIAETMQESTEELMQDIENEEECISNTTTETEEKETICKEI